MHTTTIAFFILRITIAYLFLSPLKKFILSWKNTVDMVRFLCPIQPQLMAVTMIIIMLVGSLSILFGFYGQIGAFFLMLECFLGYHLYDKYTKKIAMLQLSTQSSQDDQQILKSAKGLGIMGNKTAGQKNLVIAAVLFFIMLIGTGPGSIT